MTNSPKNTASGALSETGDKTPVDLIISAPWIIPIVPRNAVYQDCSLVIHQGDIIDLLPEAEALRKYRAAEHTVLQTTVLMPGLVNAHGHAAMSLLRGYADDFPLQQWLNDYIWPAESQWVNGDFVADGTQLAVAEMIRSGTTCYADMYFYPDHIAQVVRHSGIRAQIAFPVLEFPTAWARDASDYIHKGLQLYDDCKDDALIRIAFGPHAPYTVNDDTLERIATLSSELEAPVQIHLHETAQEVADAIADKGSRPIVRLNQIGLLSPATQCVHMTQITNEDIQLLADTDAQVIHCPQSNLKLASGLCPVQKLLDADVNVALGTDGAASNNSLDLFKELNMAALLAKGLGKATDLPAEQALYMATMGGAKALGMTDRIGSLEAGKAADLIAINLADVSTSPLYNLHSQLVYTNVGHQVTHAWVNGVALLKDRELQTIDSAAVTARAKQWGEKISGD